MGSCEKKDLKVENGVRCKVEGKRAIVGKTKRKVLPESK